MPKQTSLPPACRRAINVRAHQLAQAEEERIRQRLTAEAMAARTGATVSDDGLCGMRPLGDDQFTAEYCREHAVNLEEMFCKEKSA